MFIPPFFLAHSSPYQLKNNSNTAAANSEAIKPETFVFSLAEIEESNASRLKLSDYIKYTNVDYPQEDSGNRLIFHGLS